jgi:hypothetical protein
VRPLSLAQKDDVVAFAPGGWSVAVREHASAVPGGQRAALWFRIQPLFPPHVQGRPVAVEPDRLGGSGADEPFHGREVHRVALTVQEPVPGTWFLPGARFVRAVRFVPGAWVERIGGDEDPHHRCPAAERSGGVSVGAVAEQLGEDVGSQLFGAAVITGNTLRSSSIIAADESWSPAAAAGWPGRTGQ